MSSPERHRHPFLRSFATLFTAGFIGVLTLIPFIGNALQQLPAEATLPDLSPAVLVALSLIQPTILLAAAVAIGVWLAPKLGLMSHMAGAAQGVPPATGLKNDFGPAFMSGIVLSIIILILDAILLPAAGEAAQSLAVSSDRPFWYLIMGMLYGGVTEELMMRWGLMTFLAWLCWIFVQRGRGLPHPPVMWVSIVLAALLFGVGHLGVVAAAAPLTTALVVRTVLLNALAGVLFGWLFWRRSLEAAMISHATFHLFTSIVAWSGLLS